ncbi:tRNA dihydrouridine synthase DusB [Rhodobacter sp. NSM]|uniref:tRNA dihydrouridine synthase DusB n=1 Tax=Rhodobacter sp. NSM TaxID=3457501 RepID=UPI003FD295D1
MALRIAQLPVDPPVLLAPMAGITDLPFRRLAVRFGAGLVVSEMVASREMLCARAEARARAEIGAGEGRTAVQLAGCDPHWMAEAARLVEAQGARIIDINMGCPSKRVTNGWSGSALMREPDRALSLVEAVVGAVSVPVTLKMRLGWDDGSLNAPEIARRAEGAGVAMITIHGRTRCQFYTGHADWHAIRPVVQSVSVPVVANGDITSDETARTALAASGAAGVMIGRGAQGRPWLPGQIGAALAGRPVPRAPAAGDLADLVIGHYEEILSFYGRDLGLRVARKHLNWYLEAADLAAHRVPVVTGTDPAQVIRRLREAFAEQERVAA